MDESNDQWMKWCMTIQMNEWKNVEANGWNDAQPYQRWYEWMDEPRSPWMKWCFSINYDVNERMYKSMNEIIYDHLNDGTINGWWCKLKDEYINQWMKCCMSISIVMWISEWNDVRLHQLIQKSMNQMMHDNINDDVKEQK